MSSCRRYVALALALMLVAGGRAQAGGPEAASAGSLTAQIAKAMPQAPDTEHHKLEFGLELFDAVHTGVAMFEWEVAAVETTGVIGAGSTAGAIGALGITMEVMAPLAGEAAVLLAIGNAHAEAINGLIEEEIRSGFSLGVVLGADDRKPDYVKWNFVKHGPVHNSVYPEYGKKFQDAYNGSLAAGYAQGRRLLASRVQRGAFFEDLYARMSVPPSITYGEDQDNWSERSWRDYYIDCAATFRLHHLK